MIFLWIFPVFNHGPSPKPVLPTIFTCVEAYPLPPVPHNSYQIQSIPVQYSSIPIYSPFNRGIPFQSPPVYRCPNKSKASAKESEIESRFSCFCVFMPVAPVDGLMCLNVSYMYVKYDPPGGCIS